MRRAVSFLIAILAFVGPARATASESGAPRNYAITDDLSQPLFDDVVHEVLRVPMRDGTRLYAEVWRPRAQGRYGVILESSPYNGGNSRSGYLRYVPSGLAGYFAPRGYAVVLADVRGTGNSEGCMDYLGAVDGLDLYDLVESLGRAPWSNGRVGMTGVSYVGSTPVLAASVAPPSLKTIVPVAGLAQMYDHQFQAGVPYDLQWVGVAGTYDLQAARHPADTDDPGFARNMASYGCGLPNSALTEGADFFTGRYTVWHAARDHRDGAVAAQIPVFLVQGFQDGSVRPVAARWLLDQRGVRPGDKLWLGQWNHNQPPRGQQWVGALQRWFDHQLLERDVDTGPPVEVFLNGLDEVGPVTDLSDPALAPYRGPVRTATSWPDTTDRVTFYPAGGGSLPTSAPDEGSTVFPAYARTPGLAFTSTPFDADTEFAGFPEVTLNVAIATARIDVFAVLQDVDEFGSVNTIGQATMNPQLRAGLGVVTPVVPGEMMTLRPPSQPIDYLIRAGHRVRVVITSRHTDKVPTFAGPGAVIVAFGGQDPTRVELGIVRSTLHEDPQPKEIPPSV